MLLADVGGLLIYVGPGTVAAVIAAALGYRRYRRAERERATEGPDGADHPGER